MPGSVSVLTFLPVVELSSAGWPRPARPGRLLCARLVAEKDSGFLLRREPASAEKTCEDRDHVPNNDDHH